MKFDLDLLGTQIKRPLLNPKPIPCRTRDAGAASAGRVSARDLNTHKTLDASTRRRDPSSSRSKSPSSELCRLQRRLNNPSCVFSFAAFKESGCGVKIARHSSSCVVLMPVPGLPANLVDKNRCFLHTTPQPLKGLLPHQKQKSGIHHPASLSEQLS